MTAGLKRFFCDDFHAMLAGHDAEDDVRAILPEDYERWDPFCRAQFLETAILMPGYILSSQGDRMSLAHGVEGRFPFLDHRLAEFAATLPPRMKMKGLREKHLLKRALGHLVPPEVVRRTKQPYRAPDAASFFDVRTGRARAEYVDELLSPERVAAAGIFRPEAVARLVQKARKTGLAGTKDNMALVGILSTQLLVEQASSLASTSGDACATDVPLPGPACETYPSPEVSSLS
jgi:asparagine synthase (glutamine-hydrolysing)